MENWLHVNIVSGSAGTTNVVFTADQNTTYQDRSTTVNFLTQPDGVIRQTMTVTQTSDGIIIITYNNTVINRSETAIGYDPNI
jgi:hypothetical protein